MIETLSLDVDAITKKLNDPAYQAFRDDHVGTLKVVDGRKVSGGAVKKRDHQC